MVFAAEFGTGQVFWSMLWFTMFFIWIWLLIAVFADVFRSPDLSGWGKAAWSLFVIVLPYLGVFTYFIARGTKMSEHAVADAKKQDEMLRAYVKDAAGTPSAVDELTTLSTMRKQGVINDEEFSRMKSKVVTA